MAITLSPPASPVRAPSRGSADPVANTDAALANVLDGLTAERGSAMLGDAYQMATAGGVGGGGMPSISPDAVNAAAPVDSAADSDEDDSNARARNEALQQEALRGMLRSIRG